MRWSYGGAWASGQTCVASLASAFPTAPQTTLAPRTLALALALALAPRPRQHPSFAHSASFVLRRHS